MMSPDQLMILASAAAYSIDPDTGTYDAYNIYGNAIGYTRYPTVVNAQITTTDEAGVKDQQLINACLIVQTSTAVIVAFRGTLFGETQDAFWDWIQDFMAEPVTVRNMPGKVHSGFYGAVNLMFNPIMVAVNTLRGAAKLPVYVTGHSKGGGMAPIFAYMMYRAGITPAQVTTFAAPESGDAGFKAGYEAVVTNHVRYENYGDLIPFLPPDADVVDIVADAVGLFSTDAADFVREAATWGYAAVGSEQFIESDFSVTGDEPAVDQATDIGINIYDVGSVEQALLDAHTISVGYGYMSGVCPGLFSVTAGAKPVVG